MAPRILATITGYRKRSTWKGRPQYSSFKGYKHRGKLGLYTSLRRPRISHRRSEIKYILQSAVSLSTITPTPQYCFLNGITRGNTIQNRDGDYIIGKSITIKGQLICGNVTPYNGKLRMIIYSNKNNNNSTDPHFCADNPGENYLFNSETPDVHQMYNFNNTDIPQGFRIYYDKVHGFTLPNTSTASTRMINIKIDLKNLKCSYKGGDEGDASDIGREALYLAVFSDTSASMFTFTFDACFRFQED